MRKADKKSYQSPRITQHGNLHKITKGNIDGFNTDQDFPVNTPKPDLRFS